MNTVTGFLTLFLLSAAGATETPAQISIRKAEAQIARHPGHAAYRNALAMAYARRARETSDVSYYERAEKTLEASLAIDPKNYEARRTRVWLLLGRHEFAEALAAARELNRQMPDDIVVYGYLVDANAELGNYEDAVKAAQWMLDLRPGNVAGLTRAAYLRELHGDLEGAIELMRMAYDSIAYSDSEDRAWVLVQISHLHLAADDLAGAERDAQEALRIFPGYHYGLGALGNVRLTQKRYGEAVALFRHRYDAAPHAENRYALADALEHAGRTDEARREFAGFERMALAESRKADNANHELAAYYDGFAHRPADALRIARAEVARRHDVYTRDAYAWALAVSGRYAEAEKEMKSILATGVKDPSIRRHAAAIAEREPEGASR